MGIEIKKRKENEKEKEEKPEKKKNQDTKRRKNRDVRRKHLRQRSSSRGERTPEPLNRGRGSGGRACASDISDSAKGKRTTLLWQALR